MEPGGSGEGCSDSLGRELQRLREARAADEERRELLRELQAVRERLAEMEGRQPAPTAVKPAALARTDETVPERFTDSSRLYLHY